MQIGKRCKDCGYKIRGAGHEDGQHHKSNNEKKKAQSAEYHRKMVVSMLEEAIRQVQSVKVQSVMGG